MGRKRNDTNEKTKASVDDASDGASLAKQVKLAKNIADTCSGEASADESYKFPRSFYDCPCEELAVKLLGKTLVHKLADGTRLAGTIIETEAYLGGDDKASHSYNGKKNAKNEAMYMEPGTIYVYHIYGTYTCMNISSRGEGAAVLIRAIDPTDGFDKMCAARGAKRADQGRGLKEKELGSGPSKLTQALHIDKATFNKQDIVTNSFLWLEKGVDVNEKDMITSARVGIDSAEEWTTKPLRYYILGNKSVSVRDKIAESTQTKHDDTAERKSSDKPGTSSLETDGKTQKTKAKKTQDLPEEGMDVSDDEADSVKASSKKKTSDVKLNDKSVGDSKSTDSDAANDNSRYERSFYDCPCEELAVKLLGKTLVHKLADGTRLAGTIIETEAYLGGDDKASHSYNGKKTAKNEAMYMEPGTIYVYHIYGTYTCMNISSRGEGAAVLIRAIDPKDGFDKMREARGTKRADQGRGLKENELGSGPSKLTQALHIDKATFNKQDIVTNSFLWLEKGVDVDEEDMITSARVGIDKAEEWTTKPLRYYILGNKSVSVRDKKAESDSK